MFSAIELYLEAFEEGNCLNNFNNFCRYRLFIRNSKNGSIYYGLQPSEGEINIEKEEWIYLFVTLVIALNIVFKKSSTNSVILLLFQ